ncbi:interferon-induced GTP-binding protein Mx2-like [Chanos chanos]|uniref:Interferon-induced GTP-binding protein Mx2-like n=1 Tax=Chanos chanos TaxID=29144 RepID=A0A6J2VSA6_CHACN|nr:interferon-induced GTP-binding protein Mx2-like [Chanos chanos]
MSSSVDDTIALATHTVLTDLDKGNTYAGPRWSRIGSYTFSSLIFNTGAPQGCVLSLLLFSLFTDNCAAKHSSNVIVKFADIMTVLGLNADSDDTAYREEVKTLISVVATGQLAIAHTDEFITQTTKMEGVFHSHLDERVRPCIDLIDSLRLIGIEKDLPLPTIAVVGDQSSGKSSVLEALSGVALPRGSGIVTRCPLELKLRKVKGQIHWRAVIAYKDNVIEFCDPSLIEGKVKAAQNELAGKGVGICNELISLEIMSPEVCDLTLIDLPGIARVPVKGQPNDIGDQIKKLILSFIEKNETINLVVVPCNVDIATTEALKMAQEVDPEGRRTLAILTKPDLVDKGTEKNILNIVHNQVVPLSKGYIIVKCRGQKQIDDKISLTDAMRLERQFFEQHDYFRSLLHEEKATTQCLSKKLTQELLDHIKKSLPLLSEQITKQLWDVRKDLTECETGPPLDPHGRKIFLIETLTRFNDKIDRLASGEVVTEENLFTVMRSEFKKWKDLLDGTKASFHKTMQDVVREYDQKHRGKELPGFCNYNVFEMVVQRLVIQLKGPAVDTLRIIRNAIRKQFTDVSKACFPNYPFLQCVTMNKIDNIQSKQEAKVEERIREQFDMEQLVYTQDGIYFKILKEETPTVVKGEKATRDKGMTPGLDGRTKYPEMLKAYYEIVVQRLADQVPMLIRFFMLKESARLLRSEMLGLVDGADVCEILREESDVKRRRVDMQNRVNRLSMAQEKLSNFI